MTFDLLKPRRGKFMRLILYIFSFLSFTFTTVVLCFIAIDSALKLPFFSDRAEFAAMITIIIPIAIMLFLLKVTRDLIDKSEIIGTLNIHSEQIIIDSQDSVQYIQNNNIKYIRFANAMGWSVSSPDAYKIQILTKDDFKIDLEYVRAKKKGKSLKYYMKKKGIEARFWNL